MFELLFDRLVFTQTDMEDKICLPLILLPYLILIEEYFESRKDKCFEIEPQVNITLFRKGTPTKGRIF